MPVANGNRANSDRVQLLAVHGNGGGGFRFSLLRRSLNAGETGEPEVVLHPITLPGFEGTPLPTDASIRGFADAVQHEAEELRRTAPTERVVVLGHGIGGSIVHDLLSRNPSVFDGAILHAPVGANLDRRLFPRLMSTRPVRTAVRSIISSWPAQQIGSRVLFGGRRPAFARRFLAEYRRCEAFSPMFDILTADWFDSMSPVATPTILLWGAGDRVLNASHVPVFEEKFTQVRTVIEPDWGHFPMIEDPESYGKRLAELTLELLADDQ